MKKLGYSEPTQSTLMSRGNSRVRSASRRAIFAAFGLEDDQDASVRRIYDRSRLRRERYGDNARPDNVVRFTTMRTSRRKA